MADELDEITIKAPAGVVSDLVEAIAAIGGRRELVDGKVNPESKKDFAKRYFVEHAIEKIKQHKRNVSKASLDADLANAEKAMKGAIKIEVK